MTKTHIHTDTRAPVVRRGAIALAVLVGMSFATLGCGGGTHRPEGPRLRPPPRCPQECPPGRPRPRPAPQRQSR